jgi:hypothetical protein
MQVAASGHADRGRSKCCRDPAPTRRLLVTFSTRLSEGLAACQC